MSERHFNFQDEALSAALMALVVPQGLWLKWRTPILPEPPGQRTGVSGVGPARKILILGDSSAAGVGAHHQVVGLTGQFVSRLAQSHRVHWHLQAQTGATTASTIESLDYIPPGPYDIVLTGLGVNDVKNGVMLHHYRAQTRALYDRLQQDFGAKLIIASGMPPIRDFPVLPDPLRWALQRRADIFDAANRAITADLPGCHYLQGPTHLPPEHMASDGFHPGPPVYAAWANLAVAVVNQVSCGRQAHAQAK